MKSLLTFLLSTTCALGVCDGFAPIDYAALEELMPSDAALISYTDEADLLADKEYFPEPKGGGIELGANPLDIDSNAIPDQPSENPVPQSAPDYFPQTQESLPGTPNQPVPQVDGQNTPSATDPTLPSDETPEIPDSSN